mgnify:CR=1 FL=1
MALTPIHNNNAHSVETGASCTSQASESQEEILVQREVVSLPDYHIKFMPELALF